MPLTISTRQHFPKESNNLSLQENCCQPREQRHDQELVDDSIRGGDVCEAVGLEFGVSFRLNVP